ncbi:penicillin-insensitive murein endopeptidase [Limoniibacter endophyticus]|nr:penicillin-insensitive murein endopeptidase [Limoniibacter endophyticus]
MKRLALALLMLTALLPQAQAKDVLAKDAFGAHKLPALGEAQSHGFYSKGCYAGGVAIAETGPHWQVMRLSRNRRWGHPDLVARLQVLAADASKVGWPGLLIGDISQPRGGPMTSGHASHQIGLDADIWLTPMPDRILTAREREDISATSMLKKGKLTVDDNVWTQAHFNLIKQAASYSDIERVLVHPGIKKKLCETERGDKSWLRKIRPYWGHFYHMHLRMGCPQSSPDCRKQNAVPKDDGCGKELAWWFTDEPWKPAKGPSKPPVRDTMKLSQLPKACMDILNLPAPASADEVTSAVSSQ